MSKEKRDKESRDSRRVLLGTLGIYTLLILTAQIRSCNDRARGFETVCTVGANRAGLECRLVPINPERR